PLARCGFGIPATGPAATFDIFYWLQVTNYGVLYVLFDSAPSGSNHIDVSDRFLHLQMGSPIILQQRLTRSLVGSKPKRLASVTRFERPARNSFNSPA